MARPTRKQSRRVASTVALVFLAFLAILLLCPVAVKGHDTTTEDERPVIVGIDFGTTYSRVAVKRADGQVEVIPNERGQRSTPSVVGIHKNGQLLAGDAAIDQWISGPDTLKSYIPDVKQLLGRETQARPERWWEVALSALGLWPTQRPSKVLQQDGQVVMQAPRGSDFTPEEMVAAILSKLKADAEAFLGQPVAQAVVTVPFHFNDAQREALRTAGSLAGLEVLRLINEPTAAALAHGLELMQPARDRLEARVLVLDAGGGGLSATLLAIDDGVFEVLADVRDAGLSGRALDARVAAQLWGGNTREMARVQREAERVKMALSDALEAVVGLEEPWVDGRPNSVWRTSRAEFEDANADWFEGVVKTIERAMAEDSPTDGVDEILLVGGGAHIPRVQELVRDWFGKDPLNLNATSAGVPPLEEAAVYGAALQAAILAGYTDVDLCTGDFDINIFTLGIEVAGGIFVPLIARNSVLPREVRANFSTSIDGQDAVVVRVFEGERPLTTDNREMGRVELKGIGHAPRGVPQIEVAMDVDATRVITVRVTDLGSGKSESITIVDPPHDRLTYEEIEEIFKEMYDSDEKYVNQRRQHAISDLRGVASTLMTQIQTMSANTDVVSVREAIGSALAWLEEHQDRASGDELHWRVQDLRQIGRPIASLPPLAESTGDGPSVPHKEL
ncbi:heat shock protein 70 [Epithele typhae]|uniref:heat shock protein 70 n=1 Tax=Epithele typhae TaxID=378194 RepID=UPI0020078184|nr:heat shock protein 70 [Epithele typhae]KAH9942287.1 heat shock protein 70 [Epithele typhae]